MAHVKVESVVEALEAFAGDNGQSFLNRETGEIVTVTDDGIMAEDESLTMEALDAEPFVPLPDKSEVDEWSMMEEFSLERNERERSELLNAIRGGGAFRKFKDTIRRLRIEQDWYRYRDSAYEAFAKEWLTENGIEYET